MKSLKEAALKALELTTKAIENASEDDCFIAIQTGALYADGVDVELEQRGDVEPRTVTVRALASVQFYEPK